MHLQRLELVIHASITMHRHAQTRSVHGLVALEAAAGNATVFRKARENDAVSIRIAKHNSTCMYS